MIRNGYYYLEKGDIIKEGDEVDACRDGWRDDPIWEKVKHRIGCPAPDPQYPAHSVFRRKLESTDNET